MPEMRKRKTEKIRILSRRHIWLMLILSMILSALVPEYSVFAAPGDCSITISYPWEGINIHLYRIGKQDEKGQFELEAMFDDFQVDMNSSDAAATLTAYIRREQLTSDEDVLTDKEGLASFTGLKEGAYLILADEMETEQGILVTSPVMVSLPGEEDGQSVQDMEIQGKYEIKIPEDTRLTVIKNWKNDDEKKRPEAVTVQLIKDGTTVVEEVVLNKECSWTRTWEKLESGHVWTVLEKEVPEGYVVSNSTNGNKTAIINTAKTKKPHKPDTKLPQTGQSWWMIPMMIAVGLLLILMGLLLRPKKK